jgi:hypothetical protein
MREEVFVTCFKAVPSIHLESVEKLAEYDGVVKSRRLRWVGHPARMRQEITRDIFVGKPLENGYLEDREL